MYFWLVHTKHNKHLLAATINTLKSALCIPRNESHNNNHIATADTTTTTTDASQGPLPRARVLPSWKCFCAACHYTGFPCVFASFQKIKCKLPVIASLCICVLVHTWMHMWCVQAWLAAPLHRERANCQFPLRWNWNPMQCTKHIHLQYKMRKTQNRSILFVRMPNGFVCTHLLY